MQRNIDNIVACVFCFTCSIAMSVYLKCICWITKTYYTQWIQEGTTYIIVDWRFITKTYGEMRAAFEKHLFLKIPTEIFWNLFFAQGLYWADNQSLDENATKRRVFCWPKMDFTVLKDQNKSLTLKASLISTISFTLLTTHCQTILLIDQLTFCQGTI